jgi:hypothetical protein
VVPDCYRKNFPVSMKSHRSHDVVLLCIDCHMLAHTAAARLCKAYAEQLNVPLHPPRPVRKLLHQSASPTAACDTDHDLRDAASVKAASPPAQSRQLAALASACGAGETACTSDAGWDSFTLQGGAMDPTRLALQSTSSEARRSGALSTASSTEKGTALDNAEQLPSVNDVRKAALVLETQQELPEGRRLLLERTILRWAPGRLQCCFQQILAAGLLNCKHLGHQYSLQTVWWRPQRVDRPFLSDDCFGNRRVRRLFGLVVCSCSYHLQLSSAQGAGFTGGILRWSLGSGCSLGIWRELSLQAWGPPGGIGPSGISFAKAGHHQQDSRYGAMGAMPLVSQLWSLKEVMRGMAAASWNCSWPLAALMLYRCSDSALAPAALPFLGPSVVLCV